jgi:hypothetical protein
MAAEPGHRRRGLVEIGVDECAPILGVKLRSHACRPDEVTEHYGDRAPLGVGTQRWLRRGRQDRGGLRGWRRHFARGETDDRPQEPFAVSKRHADLFEVGFDQIGQDARVDLMLAEQGFVLSEVDRVQPLGDVHRRSRTQFDSHVGPAETASPGQERWPGHGPTVGQTVVLPAITPDDAAFWPTRPRRQTINELYARS